MHKIILFFFSEKTCMPTLLNIFRPIAQNTLFFIWPYESHKHLASMIYIFSEMLVSLKLAANVVIVNAGQRCS